VAGKKTSLITGSNAKIKINGVTLAYATDVQYDVTVQTIPIETMGRYEVLANEPIATTVNGSFSVVRYTAAAKTGSISGAAASGNGVGKWGTENGAMSTHFNPGDLLTSQTVDIVLFRKETNDPSDTAGTEMFKTIKEARLVRMSGSVNKRGILMESYAFVAETLYDESFTASASGEEDLGT
jgi:hypothetical protein